MKYLRRIPLAAFFVLAVVALFARELFTEGRVAFPADFIGGRAPYSMVPGAKQVAFSKRRHQGDIVQELIPWQLQLSREWRAGRVPLWQDSSLGGKPLAGNDGSGAYYPANLFAVLFPRSAQFTVQILLRLLVAGVAMVALLRFWGLSPPAQAVGAVAYAFSFMTVCWLGWPHTNAASLLPLFVLGAENLLESPTRRSAVLFSLAVGVGFLGGHAETFGQLMFGVAVFLGLRFLSRPDRSPARAVRVFGWALAAVTLGMALAAIHVLPVLHTVSESALWVERSRVVAGQTLSDLRLVVAPDALGYHSWLQRTDPTPPTWPQAQIDVMGKWHPYVGLAALSLLPLAFLKDRRRLAVGVGLFGALYTSVNFGLGLATAMSYVPVVGRAHAERAIFIIAFALAALAAIGADALFGDVVERERRRRTAVAVGCAIGFAALSAWILKITPSPYPFSRGWVPLAAAIGMMLAALLLWRVREKGVRWVVPVLLAAELLLMARGTWQWADPGDVFPTAPVKPLLAETGGFLAVYDGIYPPEVSGVYGIRDIRAYDATVSVRWRALFDRWDPGIAPYRGSTPWTLFQLLPDPQWSRVLGVDRYLVGAMPSPEAGWVAAGEFAGAASQETGTRFEQTLSCTEGVAHLVEIAPGGGQLGVKVFHDTEEIPFKPARIPGGRVLLFLGKGLRCPAEVSVVVESAAPAQVVALPPVAGAASMTVDGAPREKRLAARLWSHRYLGDRAEWWGSLVILHDREARKPAWLADRAIPSTSLVESLDAMGANVADPGSWVVIEGAEGSEAPPLEDGEGATVKRPAPGRVEIHAVTHHPRWLVVNDSWDAGWKVHVDGTRVRPQIANAVFQAVRLEPGAHDITLRYSPNTFWLGLAISVAAISLAVFVLTRRVIVKEGP